MRALLGECLGASRENRGMGIEAELAIDVEKALDEPAAEETGTPGDENALPTHFFPKRLRLPEEYGRDRLPRGVGLISWLPKRIPSDIDLQGIVCDYNECVRGTGEPVAGEPAEADSTQLLTRRIQYGKHRERSHRQ